MSSSSNRKVVFDLTEEIVYDIDATNKIPTSKLNALSKEEFKTILDNLSYAYYHSKALVTDEQFDTMEELFYSKFGKTETKPIGAPLKSKTDKVQLPFPMFSLDKVKEQKAIDLWLNKWKNCELYYDDKLDGVSALFYVDKNLKAGLYKRGDENEGADISFLIPYLRIPSKAFTIRNLAVRGEIVISIKNFEKYKDVMKTPRNMVAGLTNPNVKTINKQALADCDFVVYQIYESGLSKSDQVQQLSNLGFKTSVGDKLSFNDANIEDLTSIIKYRKRTCEYEIDGLVISVNNNIEYPKNSNPKHQVAFKIQGDTAVATVKMVEWNVSKQGFFKPRVNIENTKLSCVDISWATGFNAKFIKDNGIGPGAKILITRSGDVIPYILEIIEPKEPQMPNDKNAIWNESGVELMLKQGAQNDEMEIKRIISFFSELGAKFLAESTITKLYYSGNYTLKDFFNLTEKSIMNIDGFKEKSSTRIIDAIQKSIKNVEISDVMAASSFFPNFGSKRLKLITDEIKNVHLIFDTSKLDGIRDEILKIKGFKKLADVFVDNLIQFNLFLKGHPEITILQNDKKESNHTVNINNFFNNKTFVFSGVRDALLQKDIESFGGRVTTGVSKQTNVVIVKDLNFTSTKINTARENGAQIMLLEDVQKLMDSTKQ